MSLSPRDLRTIGTVVGVVIFVGPLTAMFISMRSWSEQRRLEKAAEDQGVQARRLAAAKKRAATRRLRPGPSRRRPIATKPTGVPLGKPVDPRPGVATGPLTIELKRVSHREIEVVLRNTSSEKLRLAVPDKQGGLLVVTSPGKPPRRLPGPLFDANRDDYVLPLRPGAEQTLEFRSEKGFPRGAIQVIYDSRGEGLPERVWRGQAASNVVSD